MAALKKISLSKKKISASIDNFEGRQIEFVALNYLINHPKNVRKHPRDQINQIIKSIREYGWTNPVLIAEDNVIIAGHGRVEAARKLGLLKVPCIVLEGLSEKKKLAYMIADNKIPMNAGWDDKALREVLYDLSEMDANLDFKELGFTDKDLSTLLPEGSRAGKTDPDEIPENAVPRAKLGDVWILGDHRLVCGDSTKREVVEKCLNGNIPNLCVTDPPYGINYEPNWRNNAFYADGSSMRTPARSIGKVLNDDRANWREAWELFPGNVIYAWSPPGGLLMTAGNSLIESGFSLRTQIIWIKSYIVFGRGNYHSQYEPCWYAVRKGKTANWQGSRKESTAWMIDKPQRNETGHSAQKPIECMLKPIQNNSASGEFVYEPFSGSGTTIIACEMSNRKCLAIELNPKYIDVAVERWEKFTGKTATKE